MEKPADLREKLIGFNYKMGGWPKYFGDENVIKMVAVFRFVLYAQGHSINTVVPTLSELETFYLKMRVMWKYFGFPKHTDMGLPPNTTEDWPSIAREYWFYISEKDRELFNYVKYESNTFPGCDYIKEVLEQNKSGKFAFDSETPGWYKKVKNNGDLVKELVKMVTLIGEGDFADGVRKFECMSDPEVSLVVSDKP